MIIFNHGFIPPNVYRTTERYIAYVDLIARSGYIVFRSDYRGHDRSEGQAGGAYSRPDYTVDVLNAVASMKRYPDADPNRIGMWGHSMGGAGTYHLAAKRPGLWAGLAVAAPFGGGGVSDVTYDTANADEMQVLISGGLGESETGGPSINIIPKSGGNEFRVNESKCVAVSDAVCEFVIQKEPIS